MTTRFRNIGIALALGIAAPAYAQSGGSQSRSGMDMRQMMGQCAQMRRQTQSGARMSPDMQSMMKQCDEMDAKMGGGGSNQAPPTRTR